MIVFADETGTGSEYRACYAIGALAIPDDELDNFNEWFADKTAQHGVVGELKWKRIRNSHGAMNLSLDALRLILDRGYDFSCIVVFKSTYRNWSSSDRVGAFYKTYTQLLKHVARDKGDEDLQVFIDHRSDAYPKQDEVVEIITNHMLRQISRQARIEKVEKSDSRLFPGIQIADIITGAIGGSHNAYWEESFRLHAGKELLIQRLARTLGWDSLHYDTYPESRFNVWHFPIDHRGDPERKRVRVDSSVEYVLKSDVSASS